MECSEVKMDKQEEHCDDTTKAEPTETDVGSVQNKTEETKDTDGGSSKGVQQKAGYASIKSEFLVPDHKPTLNLNFVSSEVKEKLLTTETTTAEETDNQLSGKKHATSEDATEGEPPQKVSKLKGRNKKRPKTERIEDKDRMCPAIKSNRECQFGENCKFSHNKEEFMKQKQPDLQGTCPNFSKFGFCEYSIACRFAHSHLKDNLENVKNEELFEKTKSQKAVNILDHETRRKLWKRKYDFQRANKAVKAVEKNFRGQNSPTEKAASVSSDEVLQKTVKETNSEDVSANVESKAEDSNGQLVMSDPEKVARIQDGAVRTMGQITDEEVISLRPAEKKLIDFKDKLYLAPLTTVGNLPFRRICKNYGADVTCGEMALASELLKGKLSEWSLIKRHPCEDIFGVQICGSYPDIMTRCAQLLTESFDVDFIDINCGCPIDLIFKKGAGSALMGKATKLEQICRSMKGVMGDTPLTVKVRTGVYDSKNVAHSLIPRLRDAGVSLVTVHGRSREQRYTKTANWDYIDQCAAAGAPMPVFGNGDILSYEDANVRRQQTGVSGLMIARGALIKPWIFTEIKEERHWDISSNERLDMLRDFTNYGLEQWGSDNQGVENTRRFLLEWLSFCTDTSLLECWRFCLRKSMRGLHTM